MCREYVPTSARTAPGRAHERDSGAGMGRADHALAAWNRANRRPRAAGADRWPQRVLGERSPPASGAKICPDTVRRRRRRHRAARGKAESLRPVRDRLHRTGRRGPEPTRRAGHRPEPMLRAPAAVHPRAVPGRCARGRQGPRRRSHGAPRTTRLPAPAVSRRRLRHSRRRDPHQGPGHVGSSAAPRSSGPASRPRRTGSTSPVHGAHTETTGESSCWSSALCRLCRRSRPASNSMWTSQSTRGRCHRRVRRWTRPRNRAATRCGSCPSSGSPRSTHRTRWPRVRYCPPATPQPPARW